VNQKVTSQQNKPNVILIGGDVYYRRLLRDAGKKAIAINAISDIAKYADDCAAVMFTGGADVHPDLYGGTHLNISYVDEQRDRRDITVLDECRKYGIRATGICRGFQFLNVMCGGKMYQHIDKHAGCMHDVLYPATGEVSFVTSTHHQLVSLPHDAIPIAWSYPNMSKTYIGPYAIEVNGPHHEIESAIFPNKNVFGVQFHPELMREKSPGRVYYVQILSDFMNLSMNKFIELYGYSGDEHERRGKSIEARR